MPKAKIKKAKKWNEQHRAAHQLLNEELNGVLQYLRTVHFLAFILIVASIFASIYATRILFQNSQQAVVGFLVMLVASLITILISASALHPWILPRFLLPLNLENFETKELLNLFKKPEEYILLLKNHIQVLTDNFLIPKLKRLHAAMAVFILGVSIAIVLAVALP